MVRHLLCMLLLFYVMFNCRIAKMISRVWPSASNCLGAHAARTAGKSFTFGGGWGGDDVVLDAVYTDRFIRDHVMAEAKRQKGVGLQSTPLLFLAEILSARESQP